MAQSPYFSGHGGQHSPNPPGAAQMIAMSNAAIAEGVKSFSDEISGALKQRAKDAKTKKKELDLSKQFLLLRWDSAKDKGENVPVIMDAEGNPMDYTREEIANLTYEQAVPAAQAMQLHQKFETGEAELLGKESQGRMLEKKVDDYDSDRELNNALIVSQTAATNQQANVAIENIAASKGTRDEKTATKRALGEFATSVDPYGLTDSKEIFRSKFSAAWQNNPGSDPAVLAESISKMNEAARGPFKPTAVPVNLPDGTQIGVSVMSSPNSSQFVKTMTRTGNKMEIIPGSDGAYMGIKDPDQPGGWAHKVEIEEDLRPSNFDVNNDGTLDEGEFNNMLGAWQAEDSFATMMMLNNPDFKAGMKVSVPATRQTPPATPTPAAPPAGETEEERMVREFNEAQEGN